MKIKELKKLLDSTPGVHINKIFIEFKLSNKSNEKKELTKFNDFITFNYECMELTVVEWEIDKKMFNNTLFNNTLTATVFKSEYIEKLRTYHNLTQLNKGED